MSETERPHAKYLKKIGFNKFAEFRILDDLTSELRLSDHDTADEERAIYAWVIDGEIVRIGCCQSTLRKRISDAARWMELRLLKTSRVKDEKRRAKEYKDAKRWKCRLWKTDKFAEIWGRGGTIVDTPIGKINIYLAEENALLQKFKPPLNNSYQR